MGVIPALLIALRRRRSHHGVHMPHYKQLVGAHRLHRSIDAQVLRGGACKFLLQLVDAVTIFLENGRVLQNVRASDAHGFTDFYLDLFLADCRLAFAVDFFFKGALAGFAAPFPDIFMPPIGPRFPPVECPPWSPISMPSCGLDGCFFFSKSSGKLSIKALTNPTVESKL